MSLTFSFEAAWLVWSHNRTSGFALHLFANKHKSRFDMYLARIEAFRRQFAGTWMIRELLSSGGIVVVVDKNLNFNFYTH